MALVVLLLQLRLWVLLRASLWWVSRRIVLVGNTVLLRLEVNLKKLLLLHAGVPVLLLLLKMTTAAVHIRWVRWMLNHHHTAATVLDCC